MDGASPAALPPINSPQPQMAPFGQPGIPSGQPMNRPPGRPLGDPEADRAKIERNAEQRRIESVLPKQMDSKVIIYRTHGGRVRPGSKAVMQILVSELEEAVKSNSVSSTDEYIGNKLAERFGQEGTFQCKFVDRGGRPVTTIPAWDVSLSPEEDVEEEQEQFEEDDQEERAPYPQNPNFGYPPQPPQAPPLNLDTVSQVFRGERADAQRQSNDMTMMVTTMMANMQQQAQIQAQAQQQMMLQFQQQQQEATRQSRIEADAREERAEKRRAERNQTLLALAPVLLPFASKMLGLDKEKGIDPATAVLIEMVKSKGSDGELLKQTSGIMGEMVKSQMQLQSAGASAAVEMQAQASSMVFKNMMGTMKELMDQQAGLKKDEKEPGMLGQIAEIAKSVMPMLQQAQSGEPQQLPGAPGTPAPAAVAAPAPVVVRRQKTPPPPPPAAPPTGFEQYTEEQRITSVLDTIRRMSIGQVKPEKRFEALAYVARAMPASMRDAVGMSDKEKVMTLGAPAAMKSAVLLDWIKQDHNQAFLQAAIDDLTLMLRNAMTPERVKASFEANVAFLAVHGGAAPVAPAAPVDVVHTETAEEGTIVGDQPSATELHGAAEPEVKKAEIVQGPGSGVRRGKIPPPPPPAQAQEETPPAPPAGAPEG